MLVVIGELFIAASTYSDAWFWHTWGCLFQSLPCFLWNRWILNIRCMMNSLLVWTIFIKNYSQYPWLIPPQLGSWKSSMRPVVRKAMEIMDGVQLWWLREPEVDLCKEWAQMENMLFPSPLWDAYRWFWILVEIGIACACEKARVWWSIAFCVDRVMSSCGCAYDILNQLVV